MSTNSSYPHLSRDADGTVRIGRTRYKVKHLAAEHYQHGWTAEELMRQHSDLRPEEVYMALAYFHDHFDELMAEIHNSWENVTKARPNQTVSRAELLRRIGSQEPKA
jgi:uncharacterized protein (DUF433 family)